MLKMCLFRSFRFALQLPFKRSNICDGKYFSLTRVAEMSSWKVERKIEPFGHLCSTTLNNLSTLRSNVEEKIEWKIESFGLSLKVQVEALRYLILYSAKLHKRDVKNIMRKIQYHSCVYTYRAYLLGPYSRSKACVRGKVGLTGGGLHVEKCGTLLSIRIPGFL